MSLDSRKAGFTRLISSSNNVFTITAHHGLEPPPGRKDEEVEITYSDLRTIGNGSFGVVFLATLQKPTQEQVAIKKVLQDKRFKNRELQIMRKLDHCNVVKLKYFFHTVGDRNSSEVYLHLVLEYIPETLYKIARNHSRNKQSLPMILVKLYMYQLFRSLNYIHSRNICHRDIKPQNLLLNPETGVLKLCDFGSAKSLVGGEPNVAYICSRYYRAPELIFGATDYTTKIDIWSAGCVMAELILGEPMFPGESGVDQLVEIIKILGTPTREQMKAMNPNYTEFRFPIIRARSWNRILSGHLRAPPEAARLVSNLLEYTPDNRLTPLSACANPFFDELRSSRTKLLPNGHEFPPLFNFSDDELRNELRENPHLIRKLLPHNQVTDMMTQQQQIHRKDSSLSTDTALTSVTLCGNTDDHSNVAASSSTSNNNSTINNTNTSNQTNNTFSSNNDDSARTGVIGPGLAQSDSPRNQATGTTNPESVNRETGSNDTNDSPTAQHSHQQPSSQEPR